MRRSAFLDWTLGPIALLTLLPLSLAFALVAILLHCARELFMGAAIYGVDTIDTWRRLADEARKKEG